MDGAEPATSDAEGEDDGSFDGDVAEDDDGPSAPAFRVVAIAPVEGGELEGADTPVRITLSRAADPSTVTAENLRVLRAGEPVVGTISQDAEEITFQPLASWPLGAVYSVELGEGIHDLDGASLAATSFEIAAQEGSWVASMFNRSYASDLRLAMTPSGDAALVWRFGAPPELWASRYAAGTWSTPVKISTSQTKRPHQRVSLAMNDAGVIGVAWDHYDYAWFTSYSGGAWRAPNVQLGYGYSPSLKLSATASWLLYRKPSMAGGYLVVGTRDTADDSHEGAYELSSPDPTGGGAGGPFVTPLVALLGDHGVALWTQGNEVQARIAPDGDSWLGTTTTLSAGSVASEIALASDVQRRAVIAVWQQVDDDWTNVWASRAVVGGAFGAALVVSDRKGTATHPQIAVASIGRAVAVWEQDMGNGAQIASAHFTPGAGWSKPEFISDPAAGPCALPAVAIEPGGNAIATWVGTDAADAALVDVWVARYILGQGWQASQRRELSASHAVRMEAPNVAIDARGRALVAWNEATASGPDFDSAVWVARFE